MTVSAEKACINGACKLCPTYENGCEKPQKREDYIEKWGRKINY
jgi:hypothetical protein